MNNTTATSAQNNGKMNYPEYREMTDRLLAEGKTTGNDHSEAMINYTRMNVTRMKRIDKHVQLNDELAGFAASLERPQVWSVLTEPWCGDASQIVPVMSKIAEASVGKIQLDILLRDQHEALMNRHLTNGGKSIPKLIVSDRSSGDELFSWGPRPAEAQKLYKEMKDAGTDFKEFSEKLHKWYATDKTISTQEELLSHLRTFTSEP